MKPTNPFYHALGWQIISFTVTAFLAYLFFGSLGKSLSFSFFLMLIKIGALSQYNRLWNKYGKKL